jgi:cardiolipin synthase A/B
MSVVSWLGVLLVVYAIAVVLAIVAEDRDPTTSIAWILILLALPGIGLVLYFLLGRDWKHIEPRKKWVRQFRALAGPAMAAVYVRNAEPERALMAANDEHPMVDRVIRSIDKENGAHPLPARELEIFPTGAEKFGRLKEDLAAAQRFIHLQYFIWECDELTADVTRILLDRKKHGVEVRLMYDWFGSLDQGKREIHELEKAGIPISADVRSINKVNYRNHRKIAVIDGDIGYTGGMNMGQEYIDGGKHYPAWRDTSIRFTGQAVAELQKWFAARWYEARGEQLMGPEYLPPSETAADDALMLHVVAHGVEDPWESARRTHEIAISGAEQRVWIQSPYFVPDPATYDVMINAALAGVDVRLMMTGLPDKKSAWHAAHSYYKPFVEAGGRVFQYMPGFFHAKTMAVDSRICAIGTMNMDVRSLKLHKELMTWIYDERTTHELEAEFQRDLRQCKEFTLEEIEDWSGAVRFRNSAARLASNLM